MFRALSTLRSLKSSVLGSVLPVKLKCSKLSSKNIDSHSCMEQYQSKKATIDNEIDYKNDKFEKFLFRSFAGKYCQVLKITTKRYSGCVQAFNFFIVLFCFQVYNNHYAPLFACGNTCYDCFKRVTGVMVISVKQQFTHAVNFGGPF